AGHRPTEVAVSRPGFSQSRETRLACHIFNNCKRLTDYENADITHRSMDWWQTSPGKTHPAAVSGA
ncbi:hypothetical protein, partial [Escherichia coli]|uniref:hypothetical protein n=1 Tax=Escherichia coli TaxID=562 RepID=UPI0011176847